MTKRTLQDIILNAMTNQTSPAQLVGIDHNPEEYEVVGDVPLPVQHLHNACCEMGTESRSLTERAQRAEAEEDATAYAAIMQEKADLHKRHETVSHLRWALLLEAFPKNVLDYEGCAILTDWKMAGTIKTAESRTPDAFKDFLDSLGETGVGVGFVLMGHGRRH